MVHGCWNPTRSNQGVQSAWKRARYRRRCSLSGVLDIRMDNAEA